MSRIGKNPIKIPEAVNYNESNNNVSVTGPKGTLVFKFHKDINISNENGLLNVSRRSDSKEDKALHGTSRQFLNNMIQGVSEGFEKELEIIGVGGELLCEVY